MRKIVRKFLLSTLALLVMVPSLLTATLVLQSNTNIVLADDYTSIECSNGVTFFVERLDDIANEDAIFGSLCQNADGLTGFEDVSIDGATHFTCNGSPYSLGFFTDNPSNIDSICTQLGFEEGDRVVEDDAVLESCYTDGYSFSIFPNQPLNWLICSIGAALGQAIDAINKITLRMLLFDPTQTQASAETIYKADCVNNGGTDDCTATTGISTDGITALRKAWGNILTIANILLVISFLIMVIATALDLSIVSNYTVKKLLPRIIFAAIGANLSWSIASVIIQLVNFVGIGISDFMIRPFTPSLQAVINSAGETSITGDSSSFINGGLNVILAGLIIYLIYIIVASGGAVLLPILAIVATVVGIAFIVILARRIILTILIVLAPIAFILWAFPGGEGLFKKWWKLFMQMVMFFPVTMVLFSAGIIVAAVASNVGSGVNAGGLADQLVTGIVALISVAGPYAMIPFALKFSSGILGKIGGIANDKSKGLVDRSKNRLNDSRYKARKEAGKEARAARRNIHKQDATASLIDKRLKGRGPRGALWRAGLDGDQKARLGASAENAQVSSMVEGHLRRGTDADTLKKIATSKRSSESERKASLIALAKLSKREDLTKVQQTILASGNTRAAETYDRALRENGSDFKDAGIATTVTLRDSSGNMRSTTDLQAEQVKKYLSMSTEELATMNSGNWKLFHAAAGGSATGATNAARARHATIEASAGTDPELARKFKFNATEAARLNPDGTNVYDWW